MVPSPGLKHSESLLWCGFKVTLTEVVALLKYSYTCSEIYLKYLCVHFYGTSIRSVMRSRSRLFWPGARADPIWSESAPGPQTSGAGATQKVAAPHWSFWCKLKSILLDPSFSLFVSDKEYVYVVFSLANPLAFFSKIRSKYM